MTSNITESEYYEEMEKLFSRSTCKYEYDQKAWTRKEFQDWLGIKETKALKVLREKIKAGEIEVCRKLVDNRPIPAYRPVKKKEISNIKNGTRHRK